MQPDCLASDIGRENLLLIRHATTDMSGTFCGQSDPSLNAVGTTQARALAVQLQHWNVGQLYTSDLQRAIQTAEPLSELWQVPIRPRTALREISFGDWEGKRWSQIRADQPDIRAMESLPEFCAPGGESFACFRRRVLLAMKKIVIECNGRLTAVVTHLGVMRVVLNELSTADCLWDPQQRIDPCAVYKIRIAVETTADHRT